mmetsp:Transcript_21150/g.59031  ORF Transcript_21150/g.59031 Transcript_21150/m.59031 type:complete len:214 (-) Transcript_21150:1110-1751(-)
MLVLHGGLHGDGEVLWVHEMCALVVPHARCPRRRDDVGILTVGRGVGELVEGEAAAFAQRPLEDGGPQARLLGGRHGDLHGSALLADAGAALGLRVVDIWSHGRGPRVAGLERPIRRGRRHAIGHGLRRRLLRGRRGGPGVASRSLRRRRCGRFRSEHLAMREGVLAEGVHRHPEAAIDVWPLPVLRLCLQWAAGEVRQVHRPDRLVDVQAAK